MSCMYITVVWGESVGAAIISRTGFHG